MSDPERPLRAAVATLLDCRRAHIDNLHDPKSTTEACCATRDALLAAWDGVSIAAQGNAIQPGAAATPQGETLIERLTRHRRNAALCVPFAGEFRREVVADLADAIRALGERP